MANQFAPVLSGDDLIALPGMRFKSQPEEVLSLPLVVDPAYPVVDGAPIYLTADKKGCTTTKVNTAGMVGVVVLNAIGKSGKATTTAPESYINGDVVPVMVKGKIWVTSKTKITNVTTAVGTSATGDFGAVDATYIAVSGVRFHNPSVGSKNLTVLELLGV